MNRYGSPLLGAQAATGLQKHTFQSASVEADKKSVLQLGDAQSAITELGHRKGFAQEKQAPRPFHQPHVFPRLRRDQQYNLFKEEIAET